MDERTARLEERIKVLADRLDKLERELGSKRDPDSIRGRLHVFESDRVATRETAKVIAQLRDERRQQWSTRQKVALALIALIAAPGTIVVPWLTIVFQLRGR